MAGYPPCALSQGRVDYPRRVRASQIIHRVFETPQSTSGAGEATPVQTFVLAHRAILAVGDYDSLTPEGCRLGAGIGLDFIEVPGLSGMGRDDAKLLSALAGV